MQNRLYVAIVARLQTLDGKLGNKRLLAFHNLNEDGNVVLFATGIVHRVLGHFDIEESVRVIQVGDRLQIFRQESFAIAAVRKAGERRWRQIEPLTNGLRREVRVSGNLQPI